MRFADADDGYDDADFVIAGVPLESTTSFRKGTRFAPNEIRNLSRSFESYVYDADVDLSRIGVHDYGDIDVWNDAEEVVGFASEVVGDFADDGKTPVLLGGEHTVSVAGFRGTDADVFVSLDAHLDLKDEFAGTRFGHASVSRIAHDDGLDVVVAGVRSGSEDEYGRAEDDGIRVFGTDELGSAVDAVGEYDRPYLSFDADVVDPGFAPGVGTPEPFGVRPEEVRDAVRQLAPDCVGFDAVEVCPDYGSGEASLLAAKLVREFVAFR